MRQHLVLCEAHVRRFLDALDRHKKGHLTAEEAGELLGLSARHFLIVTMDDATGWIYSAFFVD